ncbi:MAG: DUF973 family protein [Nitrososphaerota archaeon]|jgi:uncharacterized membrane protein|nr:DUF973 family protein [Nitrososphaerota archaeon]
MSFESAKKYGFIYSIFNVLMPIIAIFMTFALIYPILISPFMEISELAIGAVIGSSIVLVIASISVLILFFISMHRLSKYYEEPKIFKNILHSFLLTILLAIITGIITIFVTVSSASQLSVNPTIEETMEFIAPFIISLIVILAISITITIINGVLYWQAFSKLGEKSGVDSFKTAGTLYLIGTLLSFIGIGSILIWISWIFAANGYQKLQPQTTINTMNHTTSTANTPTMNSETGLGKIYCSYCGTENVADTINSIYCTNCGKPLHTKQTNS